MKEEYDLQSGFIPRSSMFDVACVNVCMPLRGINLVVLLHVREEVPLVLIEHSVPAIGPLRRLIMLVKLSVYS